MRYEIKLSADYADKELYLDGKFEASWSANIDELTVIIPYALDQAYIAGKQAKTQELKDALGLN